MPETQNGNHSWTGLVSQPSHARARASLSAWGTRGDNGIHSLALVYVMTEFCISPILESGLSHFATFTFKNRE